MGIILICIGIVLLLFVLYANSNFSKKTRIFSPYSLLTSSWYNYKKQFILQNGRSIDPAQNNITTSEAQSYALLRAVWIDDKPTFDLVWSWTEKNMKRPTDHLFGWRYGELANHTYGFMPNGGNNSAADADSDIAYALVLASKRWHNSAYLNDAKPIIADLWRYETATANSHRYLIAGNWAQDQQQLIVNVSYFAPYEWRTFAAVDPKDNWNSLINPAYALLEKVGFAPLNTGKGIGLPPDWVAINRQTGALSAPTETGLTTNYSFDAMRTPWRIALDYRWYKDPQAYTYLKNDYSFLAKEYVQKHKIVSGYTHNGQPISTVEDPAMYATSLGYFDTVNKNLAQKIYNDKIIRLYSNDQNTFNPKLPYYEQNWLWFGAAFYNNFLSHF